MLPSPVDLGAPPAFTKWRRNQEDAIWLIADSPQRFVAPCCPTGFGKSLMGMGYTLLSGDRALVLTSTKGLQNQYLRDWADVIVDIRGQNNYECTVNQHYDMGNLFTPDEHDGRAPRIVTVDEGPCHAGMTCELKQGGCPYFDQVKVAKAGKRVLTNYSYWFNNPDTLGKFECLILDEAHNAPDELSEYMAFDISNFEIEGLLGTRWPYNFRTLKVNQWATWAEDQKERIALKIAAAKEQVRDKKGSRRLLREVKQLVELKGKIEELADMNSGWVGEPIEGYRQQIKMRFDPVWPMEKAEKHLFRGVKKVVLMSATMRPKTLDILGIKKSDQKFVEYPSDFPLARRPVYHIPTIRLTHRSTDDDLRLWVARGDQIMRPRMDRKGIFHTISYKRRDIVMANSKLASITMDDGLPFLMQHDRDNTRDVVEEFKARTVPCVLVSPSMSTGWDFPYDQCEYQIIGKVPFSDGRSEIMKIRNIQDKDYAFYMAYVELVQMAGRGMRAKDDSCETFIIDDSFTWFAFKYAHFAPKYFMDSIVMAKVIPQPLPKLVRGVWSA